MTGVGVFGVSAMAEAYYKGTGSAQGSFSVEFRLSATPASEQHFSAATI
jgi:hypothetical protein